LEIPEPSLFEASGHLHSQAKPAAYRQNQQPNDRGTVLYQQTETK